MSLAEEKRWRDVALILLAVSLVLTIIQQVYGPVLIWTFQFFVIYLPTVFSLVIYFAVKLKNSSRNREEGISS